MALLSLIARLGLDKTGFDAGMQAAGRKAEAFGSTLKSSLAGAFSAAAITGFLKSVADSVGRIKDLSEQYGITTDEVQRFDFALKQSGMQFEDLGTAINKMGIARRAAVEGNRELEETFARYGIKIADLNDPQKRNIDLLKMLVSAMAGMNITSREQTDIAELLGGKAMRLANVMQDLANVEPPAMFDDAQIQQIDKAMKAWERLWLQLQVFSTPAMTTIAEMLERVSKAASPKTGTGARVEAISGLLPGALPVTIGKEIAELLGFGPPAKLPPRDFGAIKDLPGDKPGLFDKDGKLKPELGEAALKPMAFASNPTAADQLGRIGAFSGGGTGNMQSDIKGILQVMKDVKIALTQRGIKVQEF